MMTSGKNGLEFFAVGLDDLLVARWQRSTISFRVTRIDSAAIQDLTLTSLRFDARLIRNISTQLYYVLIMLTRGRAQRLVLIAKELEGWERIDFFFSGRDQFRRSQQSRNSWICWQPRSAVISWTL